MSEDARESSIFRTVDDGKAVEFDEGVWERATSMDYVDGYPIFARRTF